MLKRLEPKQGLFSYVHFLISGGYFTVQGLVSYALKKVRFSVRCSRRQPAGASHPGFKEGSVFLNACSYVWGFIWFSDPIFLIVEPC